MLPLAGNKHLSFHLFPRGPRPFHLSREKVRVPSVRIGHQIGFPRADTKNNNINKDQKCFPQMENNRNYIAKKRNT